MAALALLLTLSACGGPQERKAQYRAKAQGYIEAGNFPKARVALRNVLKIDPKDAEAYFLVAQVEEKEKNWRNAVANYQQVVELVPDEVRGRVLSVLLLNKGLVQLGTFTVATLAAFIGVRWAMLLSGSVVVISAAGLLLLTPALRRLRT